MHLNTYSHWVSLILSDFLFEKPKKKKIVTRMSFVIDKVYEQYIKIWESRGILSFLWFQRWYILWNISGFAINSKWIKDSVLCVCVFCLENIQSCWSLFKKSISKNCELIYETHRYLLFISSSSSFLFFFF